MDELAPGWVETAAAAVEVTRAAIALRRAGLEGAAGRYLAPGAGSGECLPEVAVLLERRHRALLRTGRLPWAACLARSLALCRYAEARCGVRPRLEFGTRLEGTALAAHAWARVGERDWGRDGHVAMGKPPSTADHQGPAA